MPRSEDFPRKELESLLSALCDGRIDENGRQRLEVILGQSREARLHYLGYLDLHMELSDLSHRQRLITLPGVDGSEAAKFGYHYSRKLVLAPAAVLMLCGIVFNHYREPERSYPHIALPTKHADPPVAWIRTSAPVEWKGNAPKSGEGLRPKARYELAQGTIGLRFLCGAEITLNAPCRFEVVGVKEIRLEYGQTACWVPHSARGFTVSTGSTRFVDVGTRFSANISDGGSSELLVTEGQVIARTHSKGSVTASETEVNAGSSVRVDPSDALIAGIPYDPTGFIAPMQMEREPLAIPEAYRHAVRSAAPAAYWSFEKGENGVFPDETGSHHSARAVGNVQSVEANGNRILLLGSHGDASIAVDGIFEGFNDGRGYSIELWFNADSGQYGALASLYLDRLSEPQVPGPTGPVNPYLSHIEVLGPSPYIDGTSRQPYTVRQTHRSPAGITGGTDLFSAVTYNPHMWHYVVAVASNHQMAIYLDGREVAWLPFSPPVDSEAAKLVLGDLNLPQRHAGIRRTFRGAIDEVAIYPRALPAAEIAGRWRLVNMQSQPLPEKK